jgi:hypothetical protein
MNKHGRIRAKEGSGEDTAKELTEDAKKLQQMDVDSLIQYIESSASGKKGKNKVAASTAPQKK